MSAIQITGKNFREVVMQSRKPVLIDFWATWCGPCRMQGPIIDELANEVGDTAVVAKLNVDENPELAAQFSVMSIPALVLVSNGKVVTRKVGFTPKAALISLLAAAA